MPKINGKLYYNNITGEVLVVINQNEGAWIRQTDFAEDVAMYPNLREVDDDIISVLPLRWGQYAEDLKTQRPVAVIDGKIKWEPLDAPPDATPPDKPFSERLKDMEKQNNNLKDEMAMLQDVIVFLTM